jgi:hypothetical protein
MATGATAPAPENRWSSVSIGGSVPAGNSWMESPACDPAPGLAAGRASGPVVPPSSAAGWRSASTGCSMTVTTGANPGSRVNRLRPGVIRRRPGAAAALRPSPGGDVRSRPPPNLPPLRRGTKPTGPMRRASACPAGSEPSRRGCRCRISPRRRRPHRPAAAAPCPAPRGGAPELRSLAWPQCSGAAPCRIG